MKDLIKWLNIVKQCESSNIPIAQWLVEHRITVGTYYYYRSKLMRMGCLSDKLEKKEEKEEKKKVSNSILPAEKKHYITVAKELLYPKSVIEQLEDAVTEKECIHILETARKDRSHDR